MRRWLVVLSAIACAPASDDDGTPTSMSMNDDGADDAMQDGATEADDGATTNATTNASGSESVDDSSADSEGGSSGEPACADADLPAEWTEVEGCGDVLGEGFCSEGQAHVKIGTEIEWEHDPPHSGPHFPMWETWGEHEATIERGYWVHNMEHGGVVLSYLCPNGCDEDLEVLRAVAEMRPDARILITPDPDLEGTGFAAISWTWVHRFETADLDDLLCFVDQHHNHAPEDVP